MRNWLFAFLAAMGLLAFNSFGQATNATSPLSVSGATSMQQSNQMQMPMSTAHSMEKMAESMTAMSEMCQMMMQMEMKGWPWKMAAIVSVGALVTIALVLLILLEIQWIRYWSRMNAKLRNE